MTSTQSTPPTRPRTPHPIPIVQAAIAYLDTLETLRHLEALQETLTNKKSELLQQPVNERKPSLVEQALQRRETAIQKELTQCQKRGKLAFRGFWGSLGVIALFGVGSWLFSVPLFLFLTVAGLASLVPAACFAVNKTAMQTEKRLTSDSAITAREKQNVAGRMNEILPFTGDQSQLQEAIDQKERATRKAFDTFKTLLEQAPPKVSAELKKMNADAHRIAQERWADNLGRDQRAKFSEVAAAVVAAALPGGQLYVTPSPALGLER